MTELDGLGGGRVIGGFRALNPPYINFVNGIFSLTPARSQREGKKSEFTAETRSARRFVLVRF